MNPEVWQRISSATTSCCSTVLIFPPTGAGAPAFQSMSVLEGDTTVWGYCPPGRDNDYLNPASEPWRVRQQVSIILRYSDWAVDTRRG